MDVPEQLDITPHPRILQVLGEIEFKPWQCVAELVDNAIDGFLDARRRGTPIPNPTVQVAFGQNTVVIRDDGPGMSMAALQNAVRAGWTSHEVFGSLGIYGVGFNIATARLGSKTEIWTTRPGDSSWWGLEIDLKSITKHGNFNLAPKTRIKSDPSSSGTEVRISDLRPDWKPLFANTSMVRNNITERLARIYGTMLRDNNPQPISYSLLVDNKKVSAWEHCVWPADWEVYRKSEGLVRPIQEFDCVFGKKYLDRSTGEIYESPDGIAGEDLVEIPERIYGWLGIQRYASEKDFGIDILRNGRKIEVGCKDIFEWDDTEKPEYPIDDPRSRGRIVGEVHLDHGYVHYTKDHFERDHASWKQLLLTIKNNEPLTNRDDYGYAGVNTSPLGLLFRVFRRNQPQRGQTWKEILALSENDQAIKWTEKWRKRDPEFRNDQKWLDALNASVPQVVNPYTTTPPSSPSSGEVNESNNGAGYTASGADTSPLPLAPFPPGTDSTLNPTGDKVAPPRKRTRLSEHNLHITGIGPTGRTYDIEAFELEPISGQVKFAWRSHATAKGIYEIEIDLAHPVFNSTSLQVRDAILAEVAHIITSEEQSAISHGEPVNYGDILTSLRSQYSLTDSLEKSQLQHDIEEIRKHFVGKLTKKLSSKEQMELLGQLPKDEGERIELERAQSSTPGPIASFFDLHLIAKVMEVSPSVLFEAGCFSRAWTPLNLEESPSLLEQHRKRLISDIGFPLIRLGEFGVGPVISTFPSKKYLSLIRACANYIQEQMIVESPSG